MKKSLVKKKIQLLLLDICQDEKGLQFGRTSAYLNLNLNFSQLYFSNNNQFGNDT